MDRRTFLKSSGAALAVGAMPSGLLAQAQQPAPVLIRGAQIFDGQNADLISGMDVLIENGMISEIGQNLAVPEGTEDGQTAQVIDADGRVLTPGLTDAHVHIMWNDTIDELLFNSPHEYTGAMAAEGARRMLMRGFTTVRDAGGPSYGLKKAIDSGVLPGPRILPSGFFISQTSGHGDFDPRLNYLSPHFTGQLDPAYLRGWTIIADGVPEVRKAVRENLRYGASQIKIMGSGSITGAHDPLDVTEYTLEELTAIVQEAAHWGTYATIHAYTDQSIQNAINAGVRSIEHGLFASEETMQMMKDHDIFFSTQFLSFSVTPEVAGMTGSALPKFLEAQAGAQNGYERSKALGLKMTFGTDILGKIDLGAYQSQEFTARTKYYEPVDILRQATSLNAELFKRSGKRHPYQDGEIGVIAKGAYGDLLLVNGNPLEDISLLANPEDGLGLIMKGGKVFKNTL
ncbi:amidohydrolase family protein [Shimia biformata]|uniref:amidohydrolase family protein n=1 Tax=Shimia biformata TaxID=1294299 RepID=UPI00194DF880|nr:amidohydrolase family protein [Shimia biformata]